MNRQLPPWLETTQLQLGTLALAGQLHHALLLTGAAGVGKHLLASHLAQQLLCNQPLAAGGCGQCKSCLLVKAGHHPDLLQLQSETSLGVDAVRELSHFMQGSPQQGGARVVLLPQAHKMTEAAANALLKTLEEPGANSFLLLQTAYEQQLLPTILSRCQKWLIAPVAAPVAMQWLSAQTNLAVPDFLLSFCEGAPLKALELLESGSAAEISALLQQLSAYLRAEQPLPELVKRLEQFGDTAALFSYFVRQQLLSAPQLAKPQALFERLAQWCRDEQQILGQNKNLALTALLLDLPVLLR
ncbi:DNA polymerase III subunit delta' [Rheinheimera sp. 4Y26]|uniref:DNA polymerase III subunit delta' n=1 Tax=Rheinheimera sp. 4Y26 TaxID=2977811 RepID=UPI0021B0AA88|nr:DNA polymerase III subunit delta' [Rheinheimera sp. 4Y26]MCT6699483.1 DNA polymerase III subunit delta' [Rheinheimera sp. 4Y26]